MFKRYWDEHHGVAKWVAITTALLFAAVLLYGVGMLIGKGLGYYDAQSQGYAAQNEAETQEQIDACFAQGPAADTQECVETALADGREDQRSELDLSAQREMATWAYWLLNFTIAQSLLGILGFAALIITIRQGRDANEIARDGNKRTLRAYFSVDSVTVDRSDRDYLQLVLTIAIQNMGQTPAVLTKVIVWAAWGSGNRDKIILDTESKSEISCHRGILTHVPFSFNLSDSAFERKGHLLIIGRLEYTDIFGDTQKEPFSWRTDQGSFMPLVDRDFPIQLAAFSPLSMLDAIEQTEAMRETPKSDESP